VPYGNGWGVFRLKEPKDLAVLLDPKIIDPTKL
jgi:hypothetical protein